MAEFIETIPITEFRKLTDTQIRQLKSAEISSNGNYLFTFVNGNMGENAFLRTQTEYSCQTINGAYGEGFKTIEEILKPSGEGSPLLSPLYQKRVAQMAKAREAKKSKGSHRKQLVTA